MLLDSLACFTSFNLKEALVTRQLVPKSIVSHSFGSIDVHLVFVEERVYCCGNNIGLLEKKNCLNKNIYFSNFIIVSQCNLIF